MSDFNLDDALAEQLADSIGAKPNPDRRSPLLDCLAGRLPSESASDEERLFGVKPRTADELLSARVLASSRANRVAAVKQAQERLADAQMAERQAVADLLDDLSTAELLAILAPSAVRSIVSALTGDK